MSQQRGFNLLMLMMSQKCNQYILLSTKQIKRESMQMNQLSSEKTWQMFIPKEKMIMLERTLTDKLIDTSWEVKKNSLPAQVKVSLRHHAAWKEIGQADYSDSSIVSWNFQTTAKESWKRYLNHLPWKQDHAELQKQIISTRTTQDWLKKD